MRKQHYYVQLIKDNWLDKRTLIDYQDCKTLQRALDSTTTDYILQEQHNFSWQEAFSHELLLHTQFCL